MAGCLSSGRSEHRDAWPRQAPGWAAGSAAEEEEEAASVKGRRAARKWRVRAVRDAPRPRGGASPRSHGHGARVCTRGRGERRRHQGARRAQQGGGRGDGCRARRPIGTRASADRWAAPRHGEEVRCDSRHLLPPISIDCTTSTVSLHSRGHATPCGLCPVAAQLQRCDDT